MSPETTTAQETTTVPASATASASETTPDTAPVPITVIGLGPMGQAMARILLAAGHRMAPTRPLRNCSIRHSWMCS